MCVFTQLQDLSHQDLAQCVNSKYFNLSCLLELPLYVRDAVTIIEKNKEALMKKLSNKDMDMIQLSLQGLSGTRHIGKESVDIYYISYLSLVAYVDGNNKTDLVYGVDINHAKKRITAAFQGSVTVKDILTNFCINMVKFLNPVYNISGDTDQRESMKIHLGFYEYLLKKRENGGMSKFNETINCILPLFKDCPEYRLYKTGHSLGGALSTLFAFKVAATSVSSGPLPIPIPVTCVSTASPKLWNESFRRSFQSLEKRGVLRHLRIANKGDPVTLVPPTSSNEE